MRRTAFMRVLAVSLLLVSSAYAGLTDLPDGYVSGWSGKSTYYQSLGSGQFLYGVIEFAVYDTASDGYAGIAAPGGHRYVYAYQIFADSDATAAMTYFGLTDIAEGAINSAEDNLGTAIVTDGVEPDSEGVSLSKTQVYFEFAEGILIHDAKSVLLLVGSDSTPEIGGYRVARAADDDIPVPGDDDETDPSVVIPEPATLALLMSGVLVGLRKRN